MKQKKLTVNSLAMGNIRMRKKQYAMMIIGIILAMVFSSGILFFLSCIRASADENKKNSVGTQDCMLLNVGDVDLASDRYAGMITQIGFAHIIGYGSLSQEKEENGVAIGWLDEEATALSYASALAGRLPEAEGEIAVEQSALRRLYGTVPAVGEQIRMTVKVPIGTGYGDRTEEKTYVLTGILRDKRTNLTEDYGEPDKASFFVPAALVAPNSKAPIGGKENLTAYVMYNKDIEDVRYSLRDAVATDSSAVLSLDTYLSSIYYIDSLNGNSMLLVFSVILAAVLMLISCLGIVNAFQANLRDRCTRIGLLRAVGATRRQIVSIFGREALLITLLCTPIGLLISFGFVWSVADFLGDGFIFKPNLLVLFASAAVSVITVLLAALVPLIGAARITPMQVLRNPQAQRTMHKRHIRSAKHFSMPKLLAKRDLLFARGKTVIFSLLLCMAILLSCFGFSFYRAMASEVYHSVYDYFLSFERFESGSDVINDTLSLNGYSENDKQQLLLSPFVKNVLGGKSCKINLLSDTLTDDLLLTATFGFVPFSMFESVDPDELTAETFRDKIVGSFSSTYTEFTQKYGYDAGYLLQTSLCALDADYIRTLNDLVAEGKVNIDKLNSGEEVILITNEKTGVYCFDNRKNSGYGMTSSPEESTEDVLFVAENSFHTGDTVKLSYLKNLGATDLVQLPEDVQRTDRELTVGAVLYRQTQEIASLTYGKNFCFLTTTEGMRHFDPDVQYKNLSVTLKEDCTEEIDREMRQLFDDLTAQKDFVYLYSEYEDAKRERQTMQSMLICMLSLAILFFSVCGSMVNNSITAEISENRRAIGTLRAVGASQREIFSSYLLQLLTVFGIGGASGFGGFCLIYFIWYAVARAGIGEMLIRFSVWQTLVFFAVLFLVCICGMRIRILREMKNSIVENIREL